MVVVRIIETPIPLFRRPRIEKGARSLCRGAEVVIAVLNSLYRSRSADN